MCSFREDEHQFYDEVEMLVSTSYHRISGISYFQNYPPPSPHEFVGLFGEMVNDNGGV